MQFLETDYSICIFMYIYTHMGLRYNDAIDGLLDSLFLYGKQEQL